MSLFHVPIALIPWGVASLCFCRFTGFCFPCPPTHIAPYERVHSDCGSHASVRHPVLHVNAETIVFPQTIRPSAGKSPTAGIEKSRLTWERNNYNESWRTAAKPPDTLTHAERLPSTRTWPTASRNPVSNTCIVAETDCALIVKLILIVIGDFHKPFFWLLLPNNVKMTGPTTICIAKQPLSCSPVHQTHNFPLELRRPVTQH